MYCFRLKLPDGGKSVGLLTLHDTEIAQLGNKKRHSLDILDMTQVQVMNVFQFLVISAHDQLRGQLGIMIQELMVMLYPQSSPLGSVHNL